SSAEHRVPDRTAAHGRHAGRPRQLARGARRDPASSHRGSSRRSTGRCVMLGRGRIRRLEADLEQSRLQLVEARAENAKMRELIDKLWELVGVEAQRCNELLERLLSMKERGATGGQIPIRPPAPDPL